jgi:septal ring factor EnvC (AmiA/AmiB activator)
MKKYIIIGIGLLWSLLLLVSLPAVCSAEELPETITMSREQFNELQTIINRQENLLTELSNMSAVQEMNSSELKKLIEEQRLSYQKIKSELTSAQESLLNSKKTIAEQNKSLQTLSIQIKQEKSRSELKQRQKAFWGFAGGVLVGAIAASR